MLGAARLLEGPSSLAREGLLAVAVGRAPPRAKACSGGARGRGAGGAGSRGALGPRGAPVVRPCRAAGSAPQLSPLDRRRARPCRRDRRRPVRARHRLVPGQDCYRCHSYTGTHRGDSGQPPWSLDPEGFVPFDVVAEELADAIDDKSFLEFGTGELKWRRSRQVPAGYVSNDPPLRHHPGQLAPERVAGRHRARPARTSG